MKSLLLKTSIIFDDSNVIDNIRQSIIDLETIPSLEEVELLLKEAISLLDIDFDILALPELFTLILSCFLNYPQLFTKNYEYLLKSSKLNSKHILLTASSISYMLYTHPQIITPDYESFANELLLKILPFIKKADNDPFQIFNFQIPSQFIADFVIDVVLMTKLTKEIADELFPYIISHKSINNKKLNFFIQKVSESNLAKSIPQPLFINSRIYLNFSMKNLSKFVSLLTKQTLSNILPQIEESIIKYGFIDRTFSVVLLFKCSLFDIKLKYIDKLIGHFKPIDFQEKIWKYLDKYDAILPEHLAENVINYPRDVCVVKLIPKPEKIPKKILSNYLMNATDLKIYEHALRSDNIKCSVMSNPNFWNHIISLISSSDSNFGGCSVQLLNRFVFYFEVFISVENFNSVFESIILSVFPPKEKESDFIISLFDNLKEEYRQAYYDDNNIRSIMPKLLSKKGIPPSNFCKLFRFLNTDELENSSNPITLYEYEFSNMKKAENKIKKIQILKQNEESFQKLIEFIQNNDYMKIIQNMNEESLSLIICAFMFANNEIENDINGLSNKFILPFYAIALNYVSVCKSNNFSVSNEMAEQLETAFKSSQINESELLNCSIDSILSNLNYFVNKNYLQIDASFHIIDNLICILLDGGYKADKSILLSAIFKLSCDETNHDVQVKTLDIIQKHGNKLIEFIIENFTDLNTEKLNGLALNLFGFDSSTLADLIVNYIQKSSEPIVINTICFISKYCKSLPDIKIAEIQNMIDVLQNLVLDEKWDEVLVFSQFMKNNKLEKQLQQIKNKLIPFEIKKQIFPLESLDIDELIISILSDENLEKSKNSFELLFKFLMNEQSIAIQYFTILLESETKNHRISAISLFTHLLDVYNEFPESFTNAAIRSYALSFDKKSFIKKIVIDGLPPSELAKSVIVPLFEVCSFQSFICLKNIASSFPFLFEDNIKQISLAIFPMLSHIASIFSFQGEKEILIKLKTSISALSFLFTCMYSLKIIQFYVPFILKNILKFNNSQVFSIVIVLLSLFDTEGINMITLSLSIKYHFLDIVMNLLNRNIEDEKFRYAFKNLIYKLTAKYYRLLQNINENSVVKNQIGSDENRLLKYLKVPIFIDQFQHIKNQFEISFNNCLTCLPIKLKPLHIPFPEDNQFLDPVIQFTNDINEVQPFFIYYDRSAIYQQTPSHVLNSFIASFSERGTSIPNKKNDITSIPFKLSVKMLRYIASKPIWMADWFLNLHFFRTLPEHEDALNRYANSLRQVEQMAKSKTDKEFFVFDFDLEDFKLGQFCKETFFRKIVAEAAASGKNNKILCELIETITSNGVALLSFLEFITQFIDNENCKNDLFSSSKKIENLMNAVFYMSKNEAFRDNFVDLCGNQIIDVVLSPNYRIDESLLSSMSDVICSMNFDIPSRFTHLVGFMLLSNEPKVIQSALNLYSKFSESMNLNRIIEFAFNRELEKKPASYFSIRCFLEKVPTLAEKNLSKLYSLVDDCITLYRDKHDISMLDLICALFNYLSPKRNNPQSLITTELDFNSSLPTELTKLLPTSNKRESVLKPAPQVLKSAFSKFWDLYDKHRAFLNELIEDDIMNIDKFKFLVDYFELIAFRFRALYFKQKIKNRIDANQCTNIRINRTNILRDSFDQLHKIPPENLLRTLSIRFTGETGVDLGGLTKEWLSLVVNELFNTNYALFIQTNNQSYQPNPSSYLNPDHIEYFKFAGSIIARALIGGHCVNAHLTMAFNRQILHRQPKLRDLEDFDEQLYKSFQYFLTNDVDPLEMTFSIMVDEFGERKSIPLIENGENILVTNDNKFKYVSLYTCYHLSTSIMKQINAFREGFDALVPPDVIKIFSPSELDLLICGIPKIDIDDLKNNTEYDAPYDQNHPVIVLFFDVISSWENDNLGKFLLFLTGSSQVPISGFKDYKDKGKPIKIAPGGSSDKYPVAHTCFNTLSLPEYENEAEMNDKLMEAIQVCEFGIV